MSEAGQPTYRLEDLKQRWEKNPTSRLYLQLAEEYRKHERLEEAVAVLEQGLKQRPADLSAYVALGRYSVELGNTEKAVAALESAVERDPTHLVASKLLLEVHLQRGDAEQAGERLEIYRLLNDRDPELEHLEYRLHRLRDKPTPAQESAPPIRAHTAAEAELEELISRRRQTAVPAPHFEPEPEVEPEVDLEATQPNLSVVPLPEDPVAAVGELISEARTEASPLDSDRFANPALEASMPANTSSSTESGGGDIFHFEPSVSALPSFDAFWGELAAKTIPQPMIAVAEAPAFADTPVSMEPEVIPGLAERSGFEEEAGVDDSAPVDLLADSALGAAGDVFDVEESEEPSEEASSEPSLGDFAGDDAVPDSVEEEVATATLGSLYLKQGHLEEAAQIFEQVLARDPKNHAALAGLSLSKKPEKTGLTAMDLLADRSLSGTIPAGVTAKKVMILSNYLKHLKIARERNHVL